MSWCIREASTLVWIMVGAIMVPAIWRLSRGRPRYLDMLWLCGFLFCANRIAFQVRAYLQRDELLTWCYLSAIITALFYVRVVLWYQRNDKVEHNG